MEKIKKENKFILIGLLIISLGILNFPVFGTFAQEDENLDNNSIQISQELSQDERGEGMIEEEGQEGEGGQEDLTQNTSENENNENNINIEEDSEVNSENINFEEGSGEEEIIEQSTTSSDQASLASQEENATGSDIELSEEDNSDEELEGGSESEEYSVTVSYTHLTLPTTPYV